MIRKHFRFKRLILGLAVGFAIAAVTAPSVPAMHIDRATGGTQASSEKYGQLDPWAYTVIHQSSPSVVTSRPANGFNYSDAGIGASVLFGAALFLLTALALGRRYRSRFDRSGLVTP